MNDTNNVDNLYSSKEIKEKLNIDNYQLGRLREAGKIQYDKVNSRNFVYELNEELEKEFLTTVPSNKNSSITSEEVNVEYPLSDTEHDFPVYSGAYTQFKEQRKLNSYQVRDANIMTYRRLAQRPEVQNSIDEIINEIISSYDDEKIVKIDYNENDKNKLGEATKTSVTESFEKCLSLLDFNKNAYYLINDWYIDGLMSLEAVYDNSKPKSGIIDLIKMSPIHLRDYTNNNKKLYRYEKNLTNYSNYSNVYKDVYTEDQVIYVGSGLYDIERLYEVSYLQSALKSINDLAHIENGIIKYRITRASEKNVWNVDVGTMAKSKAENHLNSLARTISTNVKYDTTTGETNLDSTEGITDDLLFPSRNGKQKTTVNTINSNNDFISKLDDLEYFRRKLYEALKIPVGRLDGDSSVDYSAMDILREELKFVKLVTRLRKQLNNIFLEFIKRDLICQGKITALEWKDIKQSIIIKWNQSNQIVENAEIESIQKRFEIIADIQDSGVVGKYIPISFIVDKILKMTEDEFNDYQKEIDKEKKDGKYDTDE